MSGSEIALYVALLDEVEHLSTDPEPLRIQVWRIDEQEMDGVHRFRIRTQDLGVVQFLVIYLIRRCGHGDCRVNA